MPACASKQNVLGLMTLWYSENELFLKKLSDGAYLHLCYSEITLGNIVHLRTNMAISVHNTYPSKGLFSFLEFFSYLSRKIGGF